MQNIFFHKGILLFLCFWNTIFLFGFSIRKKGFVNFSADYRYQLPAHRGGVFQGTVYTQYPDNASHEHYIRLLISLCTSFFKIRYLTFCT